MGQNKTSRLTIADKLVTPAVRGAVADFLACENIDGINNMLRDFLCFYLAKEGDSFMVLDIQLLCNLFQFLDALKENAGVDDD